MPFVVAEDFRPGRLSPDRIDLRDRMLARSQFDLFTPAQSAHHGEL
jgi:hypothetical protein